MESLIPVINNLQTVFSMTGFDSVQLPQIVVVGSQSCGKSSVLESLVKKSFLPRGTEIVTRSPVILQLNHSNEEFCRFRSPKGDSSSSKSAFVGDKSSDDDKISFDDVQAEIERRTEELAGSNKGISMTPIIIQVYSPDVTDLTVVDLPGVVKNPIGDQPLDIEQQVKKLIMNYIENPQAIILAVSPANADIATSESIKLARQVDPEGNRTLGVITKLDLMDRGTDALNILEGKSINLKLGMIGVVNRSQQDILDNKSIEEALESEREFIAKTYPSRRDKMGSVYLAKRLQALLMDHIKKALPELMKRIDNLTEKYESELESLGTSVDESPQSKMLLMMEVIHDFLESFKKTLKERRDLSSGGEKKQQTLFAVAIAKIFDELDEAMKNNPKFLANLRSRIMEAMVNSVNIERFASVEDVFKSLVKEEIKLLEEPAIDCACKVHAELEKMVDYHLFYGDEVEQPRFERLNYKIGETARKVLARQLKEAKKAIKYFLTLGTEMIFSSDKEFSDLLKIKLDASSLLSDESEEGGGKPAEKFLQLLRMKSAASSSSSSSGLGDCDSGEPNKITPPLSFPLTKGSGIGMKEVTTEVLFIEALIVTYFNITQRQMSDMFPKAIMHHLFEDSVNGKFKEAIKAATQGKESQLVFEPDDKRTRRIEASRMMENLNQASDIISGIYL